MANIYNINPKTIPVNETVSAWRIAIDYRKDAGKVVAYINKVELKNYSGYTTETCELFGENSKAIAVAVMNRLNRKKLDAIANLVEENKSAIFSGENVTVNTIANAIWKLTENINN